MSRIGQNIGSHPRGQPEERVRQGRRTPQLRGSLGLVGLAQEERRITIPDDLPVLEVDSGLQPCNGECLITLCCPALENIVYIVDATHRTRDDKPTVHMFDKAALQKWFQTHNTNPVTRTIVTPETTTHYGHRS